MRIRPATKPATHTIRYVFIDFIEQPPYSVTSCGPAPARQPERATTLELLSSARAARLAQC
jgi:hypothetical protein